jgi:hypothetical protein
MSTTPFDLDAHLAAADPIHAREARFNWHENALRILLPLGWTVAHLAEYSSPRCAACPLLRVTRRKRNDNDQGARSTRLRFWVDAEGQKLHYHDAGIAETWVELVIDVTSPRAQWSANRWFTHATFGLAEIIDKARAIKEREEREARESEAYVQSLLVGTGYTKDDIANQFGGFGASAVTSEDNRRCGFRVRMGSRVVSPRSSWSNEEKVRKACNLLTFLQQEGWKE